MEVLLNLQNKNVTLNAVHVAPEGTNCCNRLKVHFDVFQETAKKAAIIRLSTANSFELIHYQDKHIALLIPFDRIQKDFILIKNRVEFGDSSRPPFKLCVYWITYHSDNAKLREKQRQTKFHPLNFAL